MKILKKIGLILLVVLLIAQFFGPEKNEGDLASMDAFESETNPPEDVKLILKQACYDCHSDVTRYPWYNSITPVNYWLNHHVEEGKEHFNVSKWEGNSIKRKDHKFEELIEEVEEGKMPLNSYTWTHGDAKLSEEQIKTLVDWAKQVRFKYSLEAKPQ
ncbi:heme-binding domain-containing protein [Hyunsoonleella sp. SJ7]|uniref:Heme-binding domain-containing protein n=1 Tax=Hyunsoonleella aquatilis TaxID=2762758 RepID=A0A923KG73_9FLAO|nr:heme-binding domain-containing protein [Hyunsoonleella aquatilis]MBC3757701.1 heme-binding domain-containing protein [Hyunsoonleella aquatilis]